MPAGPRTEIFLDRRWIFSCEQASFMKFYDQHVHSRHSYDSQTDPAEDVEAAVARGLSGLTFAEHFDTHPDDWEECCYDDAAYSTAIERESDSTATLAAATAA